MCYVIGSHLFHVTNQEKTPNKLWAVLRCFPALIGVLASTFDWLIGWLVASALQSHMRNAFFTENHRYCAWTLEDVSI